MIDPDPYTEPFGDGQRAVTCQRPGRRDVTIEVSYACWRVYMWWPVWESNPLVALFYQLGSVIRRTTT